MYWQDLSLQPNLLGFLVTSWAAPDHPAGHEFDTPVLEDLVRTWAIRMKTWPPALSSPEAHTLL